MCQLESRMAYCHTLMNKSKQSLYDDDYDEDEDDYIVKWLRTIFRHNGQSEVNHKFTGCRPTSIHP